MRRFNFLTLIVLASAVTSTPADSPDLKGKTLKQIFDEVMPQLVAGKTDGQQQWQNLCFKIGAPGNEAMRIEACKLMVEKLDEKTPNVARIWLLKQLERIGRDECVAAVAVVVDDTEEPVRDAAIRCLANNPSPQATTKLSAKLPGASGKAKIGLINALGHRNDKSAAEAVAKELTNAEPAVVIASARVLGKFATPEAGKALAAARGKAQGEARLAINDAYLRCADRLLQEGKSDEAVTIYKELNKADEARPTRLAALQGILKAANDAAGLMVIDILSGTDVDAQAIALGQIGTLTAGALKNLAASNEKLPPASQVLVLNAIAARGDKSQLAVALNASKNANESIKRAGIQGLGRLGDSSVVGQLIDTLFAGGNLGSVAADSLVMLGGEGVNEKLIAVLDGEKSAPKIGAVINVLDRRKATSAVPEILKAARSDDSAIRTSAFNALKNLAEPKHVPEMVLALLKSDKAKDRNTAELAIVTVSSQVAEAQKRAEPVLALIKDGAKDRKADLLPLLGRLGGAQALVVLKEALAASEPELHAAALAGLCNWPDASVTDDLLKLVQSTKEPAQRLQALHAAIRLNTVLTERTNEEKLAALAAMKKAIELADRDEERKLILGGVGFVRHIDTLRFVLPYLENKELGQSACKSVVEVAHSKPVREANKAEVDKALDQVIALSKDKQLVDRAKQYKQQ